MEGGVLSEPQGRLAPKGAPGTTCIVPPALAPSSSQSPLPQDLGPVSLGWVQKTCLVFKPHAPQVVLMCHLPSALPTQLPHSGTRHPACLTQPGVRTGFQALGARLQQNLDSPDSTDYTVEGGRSPKPTSKCVMAAGRSERKRGRARRWGGGAAWAEGGAGEHARRKHGEKTDVEKVLQARAKAGHAEQNLTLPKGQSGWFLGPLAVTSKCQECPAG